MTSDDIRWHQMTSDDIRWHRDRSFLRPVSWVCCTEGLVLAIRRTASTGENHQDPIMFHVDLQIQYKYVQIPSNPYIHVAHEGVTNRFDMLWRISESWWQLGEAFVRADWELWFLHQLPFVASLHVAADTCHILSQFPSDPKDLCRCKLSRIAINHALWVAPLH